MLSDTLLQGLREYRIGETVRRMRLQRKLGLVELGRHTGLSPALLSKIERGRMFPTLPTLLRIALVFGVGLEHFFQVPGRSPRVVRRQDRLRLPGPHEGATYHFECLDFLATDRRLNAYLADFHPVSREAASPHQHEGAEFLYVLKGRLVLSVLDREYVLSRGDAVYFDSSWAHAYRSETGSAEAIVVTVP